MPRMFNLCDVLQLVIDSFNQRPFSENNFIGYAHEGVSHVVLDFGNQLYPIHEQVLKQCLTYISFVAAQLSFNLLHEPALLQRFSVIHIAGSEHEIQYLSFIIDNQMQNPQS